MFVREPALDQFAASPEDVLRLLTSLNNPMVALEDHPTDEAEATIYTIRRESDMASTYVYLCLHDSGAGFVYRFEADPYPEELREVVESEALGFTESLGFIMDDTHFSDLEANERKEFLARPPFVQPFSEASVQAPRGRGASREDLAPIEESAKAPLSGTGAASTLSRFQRRVANSDIYSIRGISRQPEEDGTPANTSRPETSARAPSPVSLPEMKPRGSDAEVAARRAKARYLASF